PIFPEDLPNPIPVANDDNAGVNPGESVTIDVLNNDIDGDGNLEPSSIIVDTNPTEGTVTVNADGTITYTHTGGGSDSDSFTYTVGDNDGNTSNIATVNLSIQANQAPVANHDSATLQLGQSVTINVLANDSDSDGTLNPSSIIIHTNPTQGTISLNTDGTITYTHTGGNTGTDNFTYTVADNQGQFSDIANVNLSILETLEAPQIDIWYGLDQTFGHIGEPQKWINILGNVYDSDGVASLSYSLNNNSPVTLSIGSDTRRLHNNGDFNIDIDYADLNPSSVDDVVVVTAVDTLGNTSTQTVTINYESGNVWPEQYSVDWNTVTDIQDVGQVIDGFWGLEGDSVRILQPGYDRLLGIGDISWDDYQVTVPITIHDKFFHERDGNGIGILMRWTGHTDQPNYVSNWQPKSGWQPLGAIGWYRNDNLQILGQQSLASSTKDLNVGLTYNFKMQVETNDIGGVYSLKVWEQGNSEPIQWDAQLQETSSGTQLGSLALLAHYYDASFGDVTVTPIFTGNNTIIGTENNNNLIGVDTHETNPGSDEVDTLTGLAGADIFVLGDDAQVYYDDGMNDYALITDFSFAQQDIILLHGNATDYQLGTSPQGLPNGTAIFLKTTNEDELIAIVENTTEMDLNSSSFSYT
ncbi:MAG: cadherin-like domain-containing protein, partial [Nostocaceae cyanobacterium]|nr:cadherin-like domain-containing protein [Nostocaceae cyanobacterium]